MSCRTAAALAGAAFARALGIIALAEALARGIGLSGEQRSWPLVLALALLGGLLRGGGAWAANAAASAAASHVAADRRARLLAARLTRPSEDGDISDVSLAGQGMRDITPYFAQFVPAAVSSAVVPPVLLVRVGVADWPSALVIALTLPLVPVFMILIGRYTSGRTRRLAEAVRRLTDVVVELARGLAVLVALGQQDRQRRGLAEVSRRYTDAVMQSLRVAFLSSLALELIATMSVALVAVVIGLRLLGGEMTLYAGLVALVIAPECFSPLREVGQAYHAAEDGQLALRRADAVLGGSSAAFLPQAGAGSDFAAVDGELLRGERSLGRCEDLRIPSAPGLTAVTGPSGRGKSSLLELIETAAHGSGLGPAAAFDAGSVQIRGDVRASGAVSLRQTPRFTEPSPVDELLLHAPVEDPGPVLAALGLADRAHDRTEDLSPGEQRRLGVARAVLAARGTGHALLLDEPTSQLDPDAAAAVRALMAAEARRRRVVVVTHEAELAEQADQRIHWRGPASVPAQGGPAEHAGAAVGWSSPDPAEAAGEGPWGGRPFSGRKPSGDVRSEPAPDKAPEKTPEQAAEQSPERSGHDRRSETQVAQPWRNGHVVLGLLLALVSAGCAAALTALSGWLIVRASQGPAIMYLSVAIVGVRAFGLFRAAARYGERLQTHRGMLEHAAAVRLAVWSALASSPSRWRDLSRTDRGAAAIVTGVDRLRDAAPRALVPLASAACVAVGALIAVLAIAPAQAWVTVLALLVSGVLAPWATLRADRASTSAVAAHDGWLMQRLSVLYRAAPDVRGLHSAESVLERFSEEDRSLGAHLVRAERARGIGALIVVAGQSLAAAVSLWASAPGAPGGVPLELAAALALVHVALIDPLIALLDAVPQARSWRAAAQGLEAVVRSDRDEGLARLRSREQSLRGLGSEELTAGYPSGFSLPPVTARAEPGRWLLVTGPSGSGKSTYADVLAGFHRPSGGDVLVRDTATGAWAPAEGLGRVAWCPQDAYLFDSTVASNIRLGREGTDDGEVRALLDLVGLPDMPLDHSVGPGGSQVSGGERQRISIARGLARGADAVILDEPTAHLDQESAASLVRDLRRVLAQTSVVAVVHEDLAVLDPGLEADTVRLG
ncbi:thiol reductant ABC exporter subunit CydC [Arthrobacter sp. UM1]|uniref:thiol reductant ABC exporter subunit CydC n=1 Tax=Arthrobacter sp. UM1 TaxID=2766776 RepID=UPI001CF6EF6D|nr:thiol reductant ABC exporter subunit CydC [Arthrobacter sp. UM1]MCB4207664.1 thiol reductant ABC exporter subunit CydC [Arthrobacter sp. UM1]